MTAIIYNAESLIDANLLLHRLQEVGIAARVNGGFLMGGVGELPAAGLVTVVVADADAEAALKVAHAFEQDLRSGALALDEGVEPEPDAGS